MKSSETKFSVDERSVLFVYGALLLALYGLSPSFDVVSFFILTVIHLVFFYTAYELKKDDEVWMQAAMAFYASVFVVVIAMLSGLPALLLVMPVTFIFAFTRYIASLVVVVAVVTVGMVFLFRNESVITSFSFITTATIAFLVSMSVNRFRREARANNEQLDLRSAMSAMHLEFIKGMSESKFSTTNPFSENDLLGKTIFETGLKLGRATQDEQLRKWEMTGLNEISNILRSNSDVEHAYKAVLSFLIKHLDNNQGGLFILNKENEREHFLELKACYAYDKQKSLNKKLGASEGLVGQCIVEREMIYLEQVPKNYIQITSGLGLATPTALVIVPLKYNEEILGAIELASFRTYTRHELDFLNKVSDIVGATISFNQKSAITVKMLEESQTLAAELREQQEEVRQNLEELQATQEHLRREANERERLQNELQNSREFLNLVLDSVPIPVFVKDRSHKMVLLNKAVCDLNNMTKEQMLGKSDYDFFTKAEADVFWNFEEEIFRNRSSAEKIEHAIRNGKETYTLDKKLFVRTDSGDDFLIGINIDVTHSKMMEINAERKYMSKVP